MNILMLPNVEILAILSEQPIFKQKKYRLMNHILIDDIDGGKLMFNSLTRCMIHLSYDEYFRMFDDFKEFEFLYRFYFLVPEDFNDMEVIDKVREHFKIHVDDVYLDSPQHFTILTTTKCNARCFYCYEKNSKKKKHMDEETAEKVANYIMKVADKDSPIGLSWFGGEPLYNMKAIDIITSMLQTNGYTYFSNFTSNAYLFDEKIINKTKYAWNTKSVQITLDGTEQIYNKTKNYIYKDSISPYKKVLNNIALLLNEGIQVTVRMNIDKHNAENLKGLVWDCFKRFKNHSKFVMYAYPIFEIEGYERTEDEKDEIFAKLEELENILKEVGYFTGDNIMYNIRYFQCMADKGDSVTISPNGDLGTCEHYIDSDFWGHIDNPQEKDYSILNGWREYEKPWEGCQDCPIYGSCLRPVKCEEMRKCDKRYKKWFIRKAKQGMLLQYQQMVNNTYQDTKLETNIL